MMACEECDVNKEGFVTKFVKIKLNYMYFLTLR